MLLAACVFSSLLTSQPVADYKVEGIRVKLYYESLAKFSRDVLANPPMVLFNVVIGAGDAEAPSDSFLVEVDVSGPKKQHLAPATRKLTIAVTQGKKTLAKRTTFFPLMEDNGRLSMPLMVYSMPSDPVRITANISGQKEPSSRSVIVPFHGGE